jgi:hypothetical protein
MRNRNNPWFGVRRGYVDAMSLLDPPEGWDFEAHDSINEVKFWADYKTRKADQKESFAHNIRGETGWRNSAGRILH